MNIPGVNRYFLVSFFIGSSMCTIIIALLQLFRDNIFGMFNSNSIQQMMINDWDYLLADVGCMVAQFISGGVIRGIG